MKKSLALIALLALGVAAAQTTPPPSGQQQPAAPPAGTQAQPPSQPPTQPGTQPMQQPGTQPQTMQQPGAQPGMQQPAAQPAQTPAAEQPALPPCGGAAAGTQIQVPPPTKAPTIQDPGEYQAYINAIQATDPRAKVSALEAFVRQYPNSVVKTDALDQLIAAYTALQDGGKMQDTAQRLLQADPNSIRALALLAYLARANAQISTDPARTQQLIAQAAQYSQRGMEALPKMPRPEGMTEEQYNKLANDARAIFQGALGFSALQGKNYPQAQSCLSVAAQGAPNDFYNVYQLALAYLEPNPPNTLGFWYIAKAIALAPQAQTVADYGARKYRRFHGGDDGWQDILNQARSTPGVAPPASFHVAPAPSPAEVAAKIANSKAVKDMSLDEIQLILTYGNPQTAAQIWDQVKGKPLGVGGAKLVGITDTTAQIAALSDDMDANPPKADVTLTLVTPLPAKVAPQPGSPVDFQGTPISYTPNPFMLTMEKGCLIKNNKCLTAAPAGPTKKGPAGTKKKRGK
jgi:tetratricopeptide (TPR) repeat protein